MKETVGYFLMPDVPPGADRDSTETKSGEVRRPDQRRQEEMACPVCGMPMPDLKGGKASICMVCGFKDSCCF